VELTRKQLLAGGAAAAAGATLGGCDTADEPRAATARADLSTWAGVRGELGLDPRLRHFAAFLLAPHPRPVREAIERHRRGLDADPAGYLRDAEARVDVRGAAARYLGARPEHVALTGSTTMGLAILYRGLRLRDGEEILSSTHDHFATDEALRLSGGAVRRTRLYRDPARASVDEIASRLERALGPRTRAVALTWVHSSTGVKLPVETIAGVVGDAGRRHGRRLLLCVDAVHALGAEDVAVSHATGGIDFLVAGCHKWLMGPRGTGVLWGAPAAWPAAARPLIPSFAPASYGAWLDGGTPPPTPPGPAMTAGGFHAFEHVWALPAAFAFHERIGKARVAARVRDLATRLKVGLAGVPGVSLVTPRAPELSSGLVCADVAGVEPRAVVERLAAAGISASVTPYAERHVRLGCGLAVDEADVDAAISALAQIARER
jgi:selenocysteine lyase/cysteine desulfurase